MNFTRIASRRWTLVLTLLILLGNFWTLKSLANPPAPSVVRPIRPLTLSDGTPAFLKTNQTASLQALARLRPLATGTNHACAILADDRIICWGENDWRQLGVPGFVAVPFPVFVSGLAAPPVNLAAGEEHTCVLLQDGRVQCWGSNTDGQLGNGTFSWTPSVHPVFVTGLEGKAIDLTAGSWHTCALLENGHVQCWGANITGQLGNGSTNAQARAVTVSLPGPATWITAGCNHSCALLTDGRMYCWGWNVYGQLGVSGTTQSTTPVQVTVISGRGTTIEAGCDHTCATYVDAQGQPRLSCWGWNGLLQMPAQQSSLVSVLLMRAGMGHTCILTADHSILCWGYNRYGQLGDGTTRSRHELKPVIGMSHDVFYMTTSAGANHTCAVREDGMAFCWGSNMWGQLGNGSLVTVSIPRQIFDLNDVHHIAAGNGFTCAVPADGSLWCWGKRFNTSFISDTAAPTRLSSPSGGVAGVQVGEGHACAVMRDGSLRCWGDNDYGQLGNGSTNLSTTPVAVRNLGGRAQAVRVGNDFTCALLAGGTVRCWGHNDHGQLGLGNTQDHSLPVTVSLPAPARSITAGGQHACAALTDGRVFCWGKNTFGQVGDGSERDRHGPVRVNLNGPAVRVAAGDDHTCALLQNGQVWCWGTNGQGQLGNPGAGTGSDTPVRVQNLGSVSFLDAGGDTTCAVADGGARCWGLNLYGQVGNGSYEAQRTPTQVLGLAAGVTRVSVGFDHACALLDESHGGAALCWGSDAYGQLGRHRDLRWTRPLPLGETPPPYLMANHGVGSVGSVFTLVGANFPATNQARVTVNGRTLSTPLVIGESGQVRLFVDTRGATPGDYFVTVTAGNKSGTAVLRVLAAGPRCAASGGGTTITLPEHTAGHAWRIYLPRVNQ